MTTNINCPQDSHLSFGGSRLRPRSSKFLHWVTNGSNCKAKLGTGLLEWLEVQGGFPMEHLSQSNF